MTAQRNLQTHALLVLTSLVPALTLAQTPAVCDLPSAVSVHGLTSDNVVFSLSGGVLGAKRVSGIDGSLIGIDFRVSDGPTGRLYGLSDTGKLYRFSANPFDEQPAELLTTLTQRSSGGFQSLVDFNPMPATNGNVLHVMGSNGENLAVRQLEGLFTSAVTQTRLSYAPTDSNAAVIPNLTAGAFSNNIPDPPYTHFYAVDHHLDTLVISAQPTPGVSSEVSTGQFMTIGTIRDATGAPVNIAPNAGMDIFTQPAPEGLHNTALVVSGLTLYCIDLYLFDQNFPRRVLLPSVTATPVPMMPPAPANSAFVTGGFIDVAVAPFPGQ